MAKPRPRTGYRRRLTDQSRITIKKWAANTAEALWAWNRLQSVLFDIFCSFIGTGEQKLQVAHAIWHMFQSDKNQREMLLSVAEASLPAGAKKLKQIRWLLKAINKIGPYRNALVHSPFTFQVEKKGHSLVFDSVAMRKQIEMRLELAGSGSFWTALAGDLFVLGQYARSIQYADMKLQEKGFLLLSSLNRPRLLALRRINEIERQMSLPQATAKPKRQRRASRQTPKRKG